MMAAFFTQLLNDNGFNAEYHRKNGSKSGVSFCNFLDVPVGEGENQFSFSYSEFGLPFNPTEDFMDTTIKFFKEWANYDEKLVIKTPYVPIKFTIDPTILPVDVVLVSDVGPYAITKKWPYFNELKKMLTDAQISFVDLNDLGEQWASNPELLHKINNLLYSCKVFVGLDTGAIHYASGILAKKQKSKNFVIQSGFTLFSQWSAHYNGLFQPIEEKQSCAPCMLPNPTGKFNAVPQFNLPERCELSHKCIKSISPERVFAYIKNNLKG